MLTRIAASAATAAASRPRARAFASLLARDHYKHPELPQFVVGTENGFLPRQDPLPTLPAEFKELESLLQRMPLTVKSGAKGLLATGDFGAAVNAELPEYNVDGIHDTQLLTALFRDYTFAASAYLLEPCDLFFRDKKDYGLGRSVLPRNIAVPLSKVSAKIGARPFMEYAQSYSLFNFHRVDKNRGLDYDNLELIRQFSGMPSEHGFILVHVAMVAHSGNQVKHILGALEAAERNDRTRFDQELRGLLSAMQSINRVMDTMWAHSAPEDYAKFRTFIMGTKNQPMFPNGVIYEGVSDEPTFYRGESGANDSIIPSADNFLELTAELPENPLTEILRDFRSYRPTNHNEWLAWLEKQARQVNIREFSLANSSSAVLYLALLDQVREFRARHWNFTKEYIIKYSTHPVATGGSPITTWLPNQLDTVLRVMELTSKHIHLDKVSPADQGLAKQLIDRAEAQRRVLTREVAALRQQFNQ
ncbi:hypothetical protein HK105_201572 [Polyrhizophydium stewartii]|uniref:Indoleamine 2,3-dioxygenase n=1 Tax=Polyrhizophydium stewartii TaxID=2732419 RepID=A0ABR4NGS5_9FUNG